MAEQKTKPTKVSVDSFIKKVADPQQREDSKTLVALMKRITKQQPRMWGPTMIGFGEYHYKYASGHEGDCFLTGFSPRAAAISLYVTCGVNQFPDLMKRLGKYKTGKACIYVKRLSDIDLGTLEELIKASIVDTKERYKDVNGAKKAKKK